MAEISQEKAESSDVSVHWLEMVRLREWLILLAKRPCEFELRDRYRMMEDKCASCIANHALTGQ